MKPFVNLYVCLFFSTSVIGQTLKQDPIQFDKGSKKISIPYKISDAGAYKFEYEINVFYSQDSGKTYKGPLKELKGHYGNDVIEGEQKLIWWFYNQEDTLFDGQNTKFKLKANYKPSVFNLQNEQAMKYSAMLPGLGQSKVRHPKGWKYKWAFTSLAVYGLIGGSVYVNSLANKTYDQYLLSQTRDNAQTLFDKAKLQKRIAFGMAILSAGIWATDIVLVGRKGRANRLEKERIIKRQKTMNADVGIGLTESSDTRRVPTLGMRIKF